MNRITPFAALLLGAAIPACGDTGEGELAQQGVEDPELGLVLNGKTWPKGLVPVCWSIDPNLKPEGGAPLTTLTAEQKQRVRQIAAESWSAVANVDFTGWQDCPSKKPKGTLELIIESGEGGASNQGFPGSNGLTRFWLATLRADFWDGFVPHELGHVLGFEHECARKDFAAGHSGDFCPGGSLTGNLLRTPPDPESVLASTNYCNNNLA